MVVGDASGFHPTGTRFHQPRARELDHVQSTFSSSYRPVVRPVFYWPGQMALQPALKPHSLQPGFSAAAIRERNSILLVRDASLTVSLSANR
jgi:hypothetical protein